MMVRKKDDGPVNAPTKNEPSDLAAFAQHYGRWLDMYARAGKPGPQTLVIEGDRVLVREGHPYEGWTAYAMEPQGSEYVVSFVTTERRAEPLETWRARFSSFELAAKYLLWEVGGTLRVRCRVPSLRLEWEPQTLAPGVRAVPLAKYETRYELVDDPDTYLIVRAGGIQPENRLLVMTYDQLDRVLEQGLPDSVVREPVASKDDDNDANS